MGLKWEENTTTDEDGNTHTEYTYTASVVFDDALNLDDKEKKSYLNDIKSGVKDAFTDDVGWPNKDGKTHTTGIVMDITIAKSVKDIVKDNHIIRVTDSKECGSSWGCGPYKGSPMVLLNHDKIGNNSDRIKYVAGHEVGHTAGLWENNPSGYTPWKEDPYYKFKNSDDTYGSIMTQWPKAESWSHWNNENQRSMRFTAGEVREMNDMINHRLTYKGVNTGLDQGPGGLRGWRNTNGQNKRLESYRLEEQKRRGK